MVWIVAGEGRYATGGVALKPLNLDDFRAEIGEELGAVGACDMVREVEYAYAL